MGASERGCVGDSGITSRFGSRLRLRFLADNPPETGEVALQRIARFSSMWKNCSRKPPSSRRPRYWQLIRVGRTSQIRFARFYKVFTFPCGSRGIFVAARTSNGHRKWS